MGFDLTHARHASSVCLAPGLFRSLKRGERKRQKLDVTYRHGEFECLRFVGFEPLGADDMRLLQVLVALAGPSGVILSADPSADLPKQLRSLLAPRFAAVNQDGLVVRTSITRLLKEAGLSDGGENVRAAKASLLRLSNVTVTVTRGAVQASFHLMSHAFDESDGRLNACLNPSLADAVLGRRQHTYIDLAEVRAISSDPARLIHQRLCGWVDQGATRRVELGTLCSYVWPETTTNAHALKKRCQSVRQALAELRGLGWRFDEYGGQKYEVFRPARTKKGSVVTVSHVRSNGIQAP
ncbi:replication protein C, IncQ-type [Pseudomonas aeruginosa]|uniref:replication protein C, IncQ-type n=1 Tax=Pseudomonas aeruginosa TaxID=287 RepID=UPI000D3E4680|nr:replication protein C, IncQ-type [Pseudomonas aeruginosa]HCL2711217.1 replication protein C [Pseudomonas aeruginosa EF8E]EIU1333912.1 replication protein C [Pseudomonas aeruginosa]EKX2002123.1 replication protein C [Pseudomonas aeruginosa]MBV5772193.1 replication protein C [Pseudomonas aeruginosa]MCT5382819.1 replication protein C [Pseudomonas aeruginosa]